MDTQQFATLDHERMTRTGFPKVIFCPGKTDEQVAAIAREIAGRAPVLMATRAERSTWQAVLERLPEARYYDSARIIAWEREPLPRVGLTAVVSAGTSDGPVAAEAAVSLELMGN